MGRYAVEMFGGRDKWDARAQARMWYSCQVRAQGVPTTVQFPLGPGCNHNVPVAPNLIYKSNFSMKSYSQRERKKRPMSSFFLFLVLPVKEIAQMYCFYCSSCWSLRQLYKHCKSTLLFFFAIVLPACACGTVGSYAARCRPSDTHDIHEYMVPITV